MQYRPRPVGLICEDRSSLISMVNLANKLRRSGIPAITSLIASKAKSQIKRLKNDKCNFIVILGESDKCTLIDVDWAVRIEIGQSDMVEALTDLYDDQRLDITHPAAIEIAKQARIKMLANTFWGSEYEG